VHDTVQAVLTKNDKLTQIHTATLFGKSKTHCDIHRVYHLLKHSQTKKKKNKTKKQKRGSLVPYVSSPTQESLLYFAPNIQPMT